MKKFSFTLLLVFAAATAMFAQKVETINLQGKDYTVSKVIPPEIIGRYLYEGKGEPIVLLNADGTGLFQPHMTAPIAINYWIDVDESGKPRKQEGASGRYGYTLLIQYKDGSNGNYPVGKYDLMGVNILPDLGRIAIYGERYKSL